MKNKVYEFNDFDAIMICENGSDDPREYVYAYSHIARRGLHNHLQGFFSRTINQLINMELLNDDFTVDEDSLNDYLDFVLIHDDDHNMKHIDFECE